MIEKFNNFKNLVNKKNYNYSKLSELIKSVENDEDFIDFIKEFVDIENLDKNFDFSNFKSKLSENEFDSNGISYEKAIEIYNSLPKLSPYDALNDLNWFCITIQAIKNKNINSRFLLGKDSYKNINFLFIKEKENSSDKEEFIIKLAKQIMRNLYGATNIRGSKGLLQSHPFSKAWWKIHLSKEISKNKSINLSEKDIFDYFTNNSSNYDNFAARMSGELTVIADTNIRDAIIKFAITNNKKEFTSSNFDTLLKRIGIQSAWQFMGSLSVDENLETIKGFKFE